MADVVIGQWANKGLRLRSITASGGYGTDRTITARWLRRRLTSRQAGKHGK